MLAPLLACLLVAADAPEAPGADALAAYREARGGAGKDPDAHVRLALWCEANGLSAERLKHLALAVLHDPSHATARGLLGLVEYGGRWQRPESVERRVEADAALAGALAEYNRRRTGLRDSADAHWRLALWCEQNGLAAEATAHLATVVRLDPSREAAWKKLGCRKHRGRWRTEAEIAAEKADAEAQKQANRVWGPRLRKLREALSDKARRAAAEAELAAVDDPRAMPAVWAAFVTPDPADQARAVQLLGQIDGGHASRALAALAAFSPADEVRRRAVETLKGRDPRDYLGLLIALLREEVRYEVRPVGGPGSPGALFVRGERFNVQRLYTPPPMPDFRLFPGEPVWFDEMGLPVVGRMTGFSTESVTERTVLSAAQALGAAPVDPSQADMVAAAQQQVRLAPRSQNFVRFGPNGGRFTLPIGVGDQVVNVDRVTTTTFANQTLIPVGQLALEYQKAAASSQEQLRRDVADVEGFNARVRESNERVASTLRDLTGVDYGEDREAWERWWTDARGYAYVSEPEPPRPTYVEALPAPYQPRPVATLTTRGPAMGSQTNFHATTGVSDAFNQAVADQGLVPASSCFAAGTPVRTLEGLRPIEAIRVGDRVLAQDPKTGSLEYLPVLSVAHNRPAATLKIDLDGRPVVATGIHRFWKAGKGWVMARELVPGDRVRTVGGVATVGSVETDAVQPVFNLEVAGSHSFFVGEPGALVHDNSLVRPVPEPFDAPRALAAN